MQSCTALLLQFFAVTVSSSFTLEIYLMSLKNYSKASLLRLPKILPTKRITVIKK